MRLVACDACLHRKLANRIVHDAFFGILDHTNLERVGGRGVRYEVTFASIFFAS
jgi:hypothetical protein